MAEKAKRHDNGHEATTGPARADPLGRMKAKEYERELRRLHAELVAMQEWVKASGTKVCVVFEGRDTAGKDLRSYSRWYDYSRPATTCSPRPTPHGRRGMSPIPTTSGAAGSTSSRTCSHAFPPAAGAQGHYPSQATEGRRLRRAGPSDPAYPDTVLTTAAAQITSAGAASPGNWLMWRSWQKPLAAMSWSRCWRCSPRDGYRPVNHGRRSRWRDDGSD
jgi:hypothetical protein